MYSFGYILGDSIRGVDELGRMCYRKGSKGILVLLDLLGAGFQHHCLSVTEATKSAEGGESE